MFASINQFQCFAGSLIVVIGSLIVLFLSNQSIRNMQNLKVKNVKENGLVIPASQKHTATIILIHGLKGSGHGFRGAIINVIRQPHVKYICPHAPLQPSTVLGGLRVPSWFDIKEFKVGASMDSAGIKISSEKIHSCISKEMAKTGFSSRRIALGGISQGAALALYSAFTYDKPLAGLAALSTWLVLPDEIPGDKKENLQIPIFQTHGDSDSRVNITMGKHCAKHIKQFDRNHTMKIYHGLGHTTNREELEDVKKFYEQIFPPI